MQKCDGVMASGHNVTTFAIPALQPLVLTLFVRPSRENNSELDIQRYLNYVISVANTQMQYLHISLHQCISLCVLSNHTNYFLVGKLYWICCYDWLNTHGLLFCFAMSLTVTEGTEIVGSRYVIWDGFLRNYNYYITFSKLMMQFISASLCCKHCFFTTSNFRCQIKYMLVYCLALGGFRLC